MLKSVILLLFNFVIIIIVRFYVAVLVVIVVYAFLEHHHRLDVLFVLFGILRINLKAFFKDFGTTSVEIDPGLLLAFFLLITFGLTDILRACLRFALFQHFDI